MVRRAVCAHQSRTVEDEHDMQVLEGYIMHNLVVGPLHEGGINRYDRDNPVTSEARGKCHRMFLGNAHVYHAVREFLCHDVQSTARGHRSRNT